MIITHLDHLVITVKSLSVTCDFYAKISSILQELQDNNIPVLEGGIVARTGATGKIRSVYFRDPDGNLLEVSNYIL